MLSVLRPHNHPQIHHLDVLDQLDLVGVNEAQLRDSDGEGVLSVLRPHNHPRVLRPDVLDQLD